MPSTYFSKIIFYFKTGVFKQTHLWPVSVSVLIACLTAPVEHFQGSCIIGS